MLKIIGRILRWLRGETLNLLVIAAILLLIWGVFSPVGTLVWWLKQDISNLGLTRDPVQTPLSSAGSSRAANTYCYIVFLTGVGDFSANQLTPGEELFLERLERQHSECAIVSDVFPYSAANENLGGRRFLAPIWRFAEQAEGWFANANILIKIRNLWRFAISIDSRYGPVYNFGTASAIVDRMNAASPLPDTAQRPLKLILIGTSGGAQVALGASEYLDDWLNAELLIVSVGGVFSGTKGFDAVEHFYHLQGQQDWIEDLSRILFPSCWAWTVGSPFNQARRQGRYTVHRTGPHEHDGPMGYFGEMQIGDRPTLYVELTVQAVNQLPIW
jgi:hypothetical protein